MEPTETLGPVVPQPATSPESATGAQGSADPDTASGSAGSAESAESAEPEPPATEAVAREVQPEESVVLIEPLPRLLSRGRVAVAARGLSSAVRSTVTLVGRYKLETAAVLLLGVGGAAYPPVWVLGVLVALPSKTWDLRDKWTGLVAPVLLVIAATVLIVVFGGRHSTLGAYAFEAWLGAGRVSRIAAVLGAGYLFWRLRHGRREPKQPPWNVPHRLG